MTSRQDYRSALQLVNDWDSYLMRESRLPGPRANLELADAAADLATRAQIRRWVGISPATAPTNTPGEFLVVCGVIGYGRWLADGDRKALASIRRAANDPRWRVREAAAIALQRLGDRDMARLLSYAGRWATGTPLDQRAAAAALCEPRLLHDPHVSAKVLHILDRITRRLGSARDRTGEGREALKKGLAYCWSVAVAANPEAGKPMMEAWVKIKDPDLRWIMRENLKKARLKRVAPAWVARMAARLS